MAMLGLPVVRSLSTIMLLRPGLHVNRRAFIRYTQMTLFMIGLIASREALAFDLPPATPDGWRLVGINANSRIFWIRPTSISGRFNDRMVDLLEFEPPGPFSRQTTLHIDCTQRITWLSRGGLRTSQILSISPNSVWDSISKILCKNQH